MEKIIGRKHDIQRLKEYYDSGRPEFIAVYGRRRVGKTFLIDACFGKEYAFYTSGVIEGKMKDQIFNFNTSLKESGGENTPTAKNWREAFNILKNVLQAKLDGRRLVVFIDELPCLDTPRSGFVNALDAFWNTWASKHSEIMLIVCGSATSWMIENLINSHGGLHNRITHEIHLHPFCLAETEEYLKNAGFMWTRLMIAQCYMCMGGIPYYLSMLNPGLSLAQNIDVLYFAPDGGLKNEYGRLFHALFRKPEKYIKVIECLAKSRSGMMRNDIIDKLKIKSGDELTKVLANLESCDFLRSYSLSGTNNRTNGRIYQVVDFFTLFYLKFCKMPTTDAWWWSHNLDRSVQNDWFGSMYEILSVNHIQQIKMALGIAGIYTEYAAWRSKGDEKAQIDLLINRADGIIDICEIKYSQRVYTLQKDEAEKLMRRIEIFRDETNPDKGLQTVLITTNSLATGIYASMINHTITLDDLFQLPRYV